MKRKRKTMYTKLGILGNVAIDSISSSGKYKDISRIKRKELFR